MSGRKQFVAGSLTRYRSLREAANVAGLVIRKIGVKKMKIATLIFLSFVLLSQAVLADEFFRSRDDRPRLTASDEQLKKLGIEIYESKRLKLFTDIDAKVAKTLPPLIDQAYDAWEEYFGKLPPAQDESEFQINGYLMKYKSKFQEAGLLRADLPDQFHGRQVGYQFWMMDQPQDYYRQHLLLHEATHAFMQAIPHLDQHVPYSYLEGMAEHFGTHQIVDGKLRMRLMPFNRSDFRGHDRLFLMRRDVRQRGVPELPDISEFKPANFQFFNESYAWAWGSCVFFDQNPRTRERFRKMARSLTNPTPSPTFDITQQPDRPEILTEWNLFAADAWEGYDFQKNAIEFHEGQMLTKPHRIEIRADRGWQSCRMLVEKGLRYELVATGQFTLAEKPKPWVSEADGVTFRYHNGRPLGQLLAAIRPAMKADDEREPMLDVKPLGNRSSFEAPRSGTLYLRLNDHPGELADNRGSVTVEIRVAE